MLTEQQKQERKKGVGSSDMAALLGLSRFQTAEDVRLRKLDLVDERPDNEQMSVGRYHEAGVLDWFNDTVEPDESERDVLVWHANGIMLANLDQRCRKDCQSFPVEAKTALLVAPKGTMQEQAAEWGDPGTDQIPQEYIVQVHHQMACMGPDVRFAYVPALIGGRGHVMYRVERNDKLCAALERVAVRFWRENVLGGQPAANCLASIDTLKRYKREAGKVVAVAEEVIEAARQARLARLAAERSEEDANRRLLSLVGDGEAVRAGMDGDVVLTYQADKRGRRSLRWKETESE